MLDIAIDFLIDLIVRTNLIFFPLFLVGCMGWYFIIDAWFFIRKEMNLLKDKHYSRLDKNSFLSEQFNLSSKEISLSSLKPINHHFSPVSTNKSKKEIDEFMFKYLGGYYRNMRTVMVLAGLSPLLGLLGTVNGMINTFEVISLYGNNNPVLMADGISEAILSTQLGLLVSFPLLLTAVFVRSFLKKHQNHLVKNLIVG